MGVFDQYDPIQYNIRYAATLHVFDPHGGIPQDPKIIEGWLRSKFSDSDELVQEMVMRTLEELGKPLDDEHLEDAIESISAKRVNGFYRAPDGQLAIRGRHIKAGIKEAANILWAKDRWGPTNKGTRSFFAEHVFIPEDFIPLGVTEPAGIDQRQVNTFRGTSFNYEEYVLDVYPEFTVITDHEFTDEQWGRLWVVFQRNGLGASRSQGFGTFEVIKWDRLN